MVEGKRTPSVSARWSSPFGRTIAQRSELLQIHYYNASIRWMVHLSFCVGTGGNLPAPPMGGGTLSMDLDVRSDTQARDRASAFTPPWRAVSVVVTSSDPPRA